MSVFINNKYYYGDTNKKPIIIILNLGDYFMSQRKVRVVEAVIYTVLVYAATVVIQVYQPSTGGYFNVGESMIYLAAMISTPLIAGVAGGIGAALADLSTGYGIFAPGTLIIKFVEGYVAGILVRKLKEKHDIFKATLTGGVYATSFMVMSVVMWSGELEVGPSVWLGFTLTPLHIEAPILAWIIVGVILGSLIISILVRRYTSSGEVWSLATAGALMILGYFLYEYFISNPILGREPIAAVAEIPINIGQVIVGISVSIPVVSWLRKAGYV